MLSAYIPDFRLAYSKCHETEMHISLYRIVINFSMYVCTLRYSRAIVIHIVCSHDVMQPENQMNYLLFARLLGVCKQNQMTDDGSNCVADENSMNTINMQLSSRVFTRCFISITYLCTV